MATKTATQLAGQVQGVAGMSEDASRIYFVSNEALAAGAEEGGSNLYLREGGEERFVTALPDAALLISPVSQAPFRRSARVTPDGEQIVFMSSGSLSGYDNTDAASGKADQEVFLYDTSAKGGAGELLCVSCNPSGSRPQGRRISINGSEPWVAATIPTWTSQIHATRVISEDGSRVFFNSYDSLSPRDVNGKADVYQWQRPGAGSCDEADATYFAAAAGCVDLISTGTNPEDSVYVDSSASGADVFFKTYESLVDKDPDLFDVYDARISGGTPATIPPVICDPEGITGPPCQSPGPAPGALAPASELPSAGNPPPKGKAPKKCPKGKHKVKRKGKVVCAKNKSKGKAKKSGRAGR